MLPTFWGIDEYALRAQSGEGMLLSAAPSPLSKPDGSLLQRISRIRQGAPAFPSIRLLRNIKRLRPNTPPEIAPRAIPHHKTHKIRTILISICSP